MWVCNICCCCSRDRRWLHMWVWSSPLETCITSSSYFACLFVCIYMFPVRSICWKHRMWNPHEMCTWRDKNKRPGAGDETREGERFRHVRTSSEICCAGNHSLLQYLLRCSIQSSKTGGCTCDLKRSYCYYPKIGHFYSNYCTIISQPLLTSQIWECIMV